jgi:hypothetical protein
MDAVSLTIALVPLAFYLFVIGALNLGRRPRAITGSIDVALLAAALLGLVIVGPMNLFLPEAAAMRFGPFVWSLLVGFYSLCVLLCVLVARPRLVIFNVPLDTLREILPGVATKLDDGATFAGDALQLPNYGVQLHLDAMPTMRSVTLKAIGDRQSHSGWKRLQGELKAALRAVEVTPNPRGFSFVAIGLVLLAWPVLQLLQMPSNLIAQRLSEILRM